MDFLRHFHRELQTHSPAPERLAIYIAGMAYPKLDVEEELARITQIVRLVERALMGIAPGQERAMRFLDVLYYDLGFVGNHEHYYEPNNSYLNIVLQRRVGLPIMLSLIYMVVGHRLGMSVTGMGFPGHFMVRYEDEAGIWFLDPFHGKLLEQEEIDGYLSALLGQRVMLTPENLLPVSAVALARRILYNLRNVYIKHQAFTMAMRVSEYLLAIDPMDGNIWQERGLLFYREENWELASYNLRRYLYLSGRLMVAHGLSEPSSDMPLDIVQPYEEEIMEIYHQVEEMRKRVN
ncbi:MAG: hypothetical protein KDE19_17800 [Caldilineaceae bacterium]|nr:hypothetical protein [Caldilineaceae bacterium]